MGRYPISLASTAIAKKPLFGIAIAKGSVKGPLKREIQFGVKCSSYVKVRSHGVAAAAIFMPQQAKKCSHDVVAAAFIFTRCHCRCHTEWIRNSAAMLQQQGFARFPEFTQNFSVRQILWSLCSVDFHTLTLQLAIQTQHSVAPKVQVFVSSLENCANFRKTSTPPVVAAAQCE